MWAIDKACSIDGCERPRKARGWCGKHWQRWRAHGDPLAGGSRYSDPNQSFSDRTEWQGDCLVWTGADGGQGYGKIHVDGRMEYAHRYAWEQENGPIPEGILIDHKCWNRKCVNVKHLRLSTRSENNTYKSGARSDSSTGARNVYFDGGSYYVRITHEDEFKSFGSYATLPEAVAAAEAKRSELFGQFAGRG